MFSLNEISQYPDLHAFIRAEKKSERKLLAQNLRDHYGVMNGISRFSEHLSPFVIVSSLGFLEHVKILEQMEIFIPNEDAPLALIKAIQSGQLATSAYVLEQYLTNLNASSIYSALIMAIQEEHPAILHCLLDMPEVEQVFMSRWLEMFDKASRALNPMLMKRLLSYSQCFERADHNSSVSNQAKLLEFISEKLESMRERAFQQYEFDVDLNEAELCFYMLRHLIMRNAFKFNADIKFLLNIPSVKAMAHGPVTLGRANDLFLSALTVHNYRAEDVLSLISNVIEHAKQHNFYGHTDARARHNHRCWLNLACIFMLQAAYPARHAEPRKFASAKEAYVHGIFCELLIPELLGRVFCYLVPRSHDDSAQEGMCFVHRTQVRLFAQSSRLFYRSIAERELEADAEALEPVGENSVLPHNS